MKNKKSLLMLLFVFCFAIMLPNISGFGGVSADSIAKNVKSQVLMDYGTGKILTEENATTHLPIASVTKLMTLLLAFEAIENGKLSLEQKLTSSKNAASMGGSQVFIDFDSEYTVENLLHAIVISSANDASVVIAESVAGSEEEFVNLMNEKAKNLGAFNTNFCNCTGLPCATAYSCANDVALIMREVLNHKYYFAISNIWMEDFEHPSGRVTQMANTNKLLRSYDGCDAGKTGSTNEAGFCMSATAKRGDMRLISVVLGADNSKNRFNACKTLFDWGFNNYTSKKLIDKENALDINFNIPQAKTKIVGYSSEDYFVLNKKGQENVLDIHYQILEDMKAPLKKGDKVGKIIITDNGVMLKEIDIVIKEDIEAKSLKDNLSDIWKHWRIK